MLERTMDVARVEAVVRDPSVLPYVSLGHEIPPMDQMVEDPANICLMNEHGGFLCIQFAPAQYDVHTVFLPSGRGVKALDAALEARWLLFNRYGAKRLITFVPDGNKPALRLAKLAGFEEAARSEALGVAGLTLEMTCQ